MLSLDWTAATTGQNNNNAFILFFAAILGIVLVSAIAGLYWEGRPKHEEALRFIKDQKIPLGKNVGVIAVKKSGLSERSSLLSQNVAVPHGLRDFSIPELFLKEEIVHELGHVESRDCITVQTYFLLGILSVFAAIHVTLTTPPEYGYSVFFTLIVPCLILSRLVATMRNREYRADAYAYSIMGERYHSFLEGVARSERGENAPFIIAAWNSLTHPKAEMRLERLQNPQLSKWDVIRSGIFFGIVAIYSGSFLFLSLVSGLGLGFLGLGSVSLNLQSILYFFPVLVVVTATVWYLNRVHAGLMQEASFPIIHTLSVVGAIAVFMFVVISSNLQTDVTLLGWAMIIAIFFAGYIPVLMFSILFFLLSGALNYTLSRLGTNYGSYPLFRTAVLFGFSVVYFVHTNELIMPGLLGDEPFSLALSGETETRLPFWRNVGIWVCLSAFVGLSEKLVTEQRL